VGTVFRVANLVDKVVVLVSEGKVAVEPNDGNVRSQTPERKRTRIALTAHEQIAVTAAGLVTPVQVVAAPIDANQKNQPLIFKSETVAGVVARFNTNNDLQIRIADQSLAALPVSGVFDASDPMSFVAFLEATGRADVMHVSQNEVILSRVRR
jgi:transmembrane sensor